METIDRIFQTVFNRYRRAPGRSLESAWRAAVYQVASYLAWPAIVGVVAVFIMLWPAHHAASNTQRQYAQLVTIAVGLLMGYLLHRRFRRFLIAPPILPPVEGREEARLVFYFKVTTTGTFVVACAVVYLLGRGHGG